MNQEEHFKNIIDDLRAQLSEKSLELAVARSLGNDWKNEAEKLQKELNNVQNTPERPVEQEPTVHVVTTKQ